MIDNIHIIAYGDDLLSRVAYAMQEKGLSVSCSGCAPELTAKLQQGGVLVGPLQEVIATGQKVNFVVSSLADVENHADPEIEYAEALHLPVIPVADLFISLTENKALVVESNPRFPNRILSIIWHILQSQKRNCDYLTKLPMSDKMESLNVSNACAIALYEWFRLYQTKE